LPTILTHAAFGLAACHALAARPRRWRLWAAAALVPVVPDADTPLMRALYPDDPFAGVFNPTPWTHRGATHSLAFALVLGALGLLALERRDRTLRNGALLCAIAASHGVLDAFTDGGSGIAFLWPFHDGRWRWPFAPIEVAPLTISGFFTSRGWEVFCSELLWVWLPTGLALAALKGVELLRRPAMPAD
jgi:inner membrane protein